MSSLEKIHEHINAVFLAAQKGTQTLSVPSSGHAVYDKSIQQLNELLALFHESKACLAQDAIFKQLFDYSTEAYAVLKDEAFIELNVAALKSLGYENKNELLGFHPTQVSTPLQADGQSSKEKLAQLLNTMTNNSSQSFEWRFEQKNGNSFPAHVLLTCLLNKKAERVFLMGIRNISRQKQNEQALHQALGEIDKVKRRAELILASAGEGIYGIDINGHTTFANKAASQMVGYTLEEMLGKSQHQLIHHSHAQGQHYPAEQCPIYAAFNDGQVHHVDKDVFWRKDGSSFPVEYTSTPMHNEAGELIGAVVVFKDISERKRAEQALEQALNEVQLLKEKLEQENEYLQQEIKRAKNFEEIISQNKGFKKVFTQIEQVAPTDASVLILGESGTGKELIARAVHNLSYRQDRALVKINCAVLPANLIESELFGHEKGAFTGAIAQKIGRFELADGGTIFLDEVGEIPIELQAKLLRVLQEGEFERLGSNKTLKVNVRIIAATNRDLLQEIEQGKFREDLYYRLNVFPIHVPALRERADDIPFLVDHFMKKFATKFGKKVNSVSKKGMNELMTYQWPGNIRELENVIERAVILSPSTKLELSNALPKSNTKNLRNNKFSSLEEYERAYILKVLKHCHWRISGDKGAAKILGLKRTTLDARIKKLGIEKP